MTTITQPELVRMCEIITYYKERAALDGRGLSWQYFAWLDSVGDITLIADPVARLAHVNTEQWQRSEEGQFLIGKIIKGAA